MVYESCVDPATFLKLLAAAADTRLIPTNLHCLMTNGRVEFPFQVCEVLFFTRLNAQDKVPAMFITYLGNGINS